MKGLPIGMQNFRDIIERNFLYVDKTKYILDLINGSSLYFLARPRRFGKTLLTTTLHTIFSGHKEDFKGLYIYDQEYDWKKYPIIWLNFAKYSGDLQFKLGLELASIAKQYEIELSEPSHSLPVQFELLINLLHEKYGKVVIIIDEYDKPIIDSLEDLPKAEVQRQFLKEFYGVLKTAEVNRRLRFLFITGISRFSKISLFSDLNNLENISVSSEYAGLLGITEQELIDNFEPYLARLEKQLKVGRPELLDLIKYWYNGYSWDGETFLINPFSLFNFLKGQAFQNYWFATGTPTFLVELIRKRQIDVSTLEGRKVGMNFFDKFDLENIDIYSILFQTGYLTIKSVSINKRRGWQKEFVLDYPNHEVKEAFLYSLLEVYVYQTVGTIGKTVWDIEDTLLENDLNEFIYLFRVLFSDISYHLFPRNKKDQEKDMEFVAWEGYFQTVIYLVLSIIGIRIDCEVFTNRGRIDAVVYAGEYIYVIEFKLDSAAEGMKQIRDKGYYQKFQTAGKKVVLVAIQFDKDKRNIGEWTREVKSE